jgi:hypothetical protein
VGEKVDRFGHAVTEEIMMVIANPKKLTTNPIGTTLSRRQRLIAMAIVAAVYFCLLGLLGVANYLPD